MPRRQNLTLTSRICGNVDRILPEGFRVEDEEALKETRQQSSVTTDPRKNVIENQYNKEEKPILILFNALYIFRTEQAKRQRWNDHMISMGQKHVNSVEKEGRVTVTDRKKHNTER